MARSTERPPWAFSYRNDRDLAAVGRKLAIVNFGWMRPKGLSDLGPCTHPLPDWLSPPDGDVLLAAVLPTTEHGANLNIGSHRKLPADCHSRRVVGFDLRPRAHGALALNCALR